jgi:hypothetical protein
VVISASIAVGRPERHPAIADELGSKIGSTNGLTNPIFAAKNPAP